MARPGKFKLPERLFWSMETSGNGLPQVMKIHHSMIYSSNLEVHPDFRRAHPDANGVKMAILSVPYRSGTSGTASSTFKTLHGRNRADQRIEADGIASGEAFGDAEVAL